MYAFLTGIILAFAWSTSALATETRSYSSLKQAFSEAKDPLSLAVLAKFDTVKTNRPRVCGDLPPISAACQTSLNGGSSAQAIPTATWTVPRRQVPTRDMETNFECTSIFFDPFEVRKKDALTHSCNVFDTQPVTVLTDSEIRSRRLTVKPGSVAIANV